jgi:hypothetical protein
MRLRLMVPATPEHGGSCFAVTLMVPATLGHEARGFMGRAAVEAVSDSVLNKPESRLAKVKAEVNTRQRVISRVPCYPA